MIKIKSAIKADTAILALLGRVTYAESHGHFIEDKNDLLKHLDENFSVPKTKQDISDPKNLFYLLYVDDFPVGYAKLIVHAKHKSIASLIKKMYSH